MNSSFAFSFAICMVAGLFLINAFPVLIFPGAVLAVIIDLNMRNKRTA